MNETIITVIAAIFAGCNVFQFLFFRSTRRKYEAEAEAAKTEAEHGKLDLQQDQYDYVNSQLSKIQQEYYELADKYRRTMSEHLQEIDLKCNEIAELKSKLIYFKGLRCYRSECQNRIKESPYTGGHKESCAE